MTTAYYTPVMKCLICAAKQLPSIQPLYSTKKGRSHDLPSYLHLNELFEIGLFDFPSVCFFEVELCAFEFVLHVVKSCL